MGSVTPNMGIYIPAAGETNYDAAFAAGMINIDQHDHSGAPNKGVPITSASIAAGSITFDKLNANVVDLTSGLATLTGGLANQITTVGLLNSLAKLATSTGLLAKNGSTASAVTITGTANQIVVTNGDGSTGNPTIGTAAIQTSTTQPVFVAYANTPITNVTGDGTNYIVNFNTTQFDQNSNYANPIFTAPVNGNYYFTFSLVLNNLSSGHTSGQAYLLSSTGEIQYGMRLNPFATSDAGNLAFEGNGIFKMTAGDTMSVNLQVSGSTKTVTLFGGALTSGTSSFQGYLLG